MHMRITGTVRYIDPGAGFWGIETDDGRCLQPLELPYEYRTAGKRIEVAVVLLPDTASTEMWGEVCRITAAA